MPSARYASLKEARAGQVLSQKTLAMRLTLTAMLATTSASAEANNQSKSRFLQVKFKERPRVPSCSAGYVDRTQGQAYHWACAEHCPVQHWSDSCCQCACIRPSDPEANQASCGHPAYSASFHPTSQNSAPTSFQSSGSPSPSFQASAMPAPAPVPAPSPVLPNPANVSAGLPVGVVVLLVLLGLCAFCILFCTVVSVGRQSKLSRVFPDVPAEAKQQAFSEMPPVVVKPTLLQSANDGKRSLPSNDVTPRSNDASIVTPRSSVGSKASSRASVQTHAITSLSDVDSIKCANGRYHSSTSRPSVPTDRLSVQTIRPSVQTNRSIVLTNRSGEHKYFAPLGDSLNTPPRASLLSTGDLRLAATARSRSLSPRPNSAKLDPEFRNRPRSLSPRPLLS